MAHVKLERFVDLPGELLEEALEAILAEIAKREGPWRDFALYLNLRDVRLPDIGYIAIPVRVVCQPEVVEASAQRQLRLHIEATRESQAFPVFSGVCAASAIGPSRANVWLDGDYDVPLGILGAAINASLVAGAAKKTLENFLDGIVTACRARIDKQEKDLMRYQLLARPK